jgi:phosphatidylserine/phosphatidylglycerophosphate/cardiolipin synthase-like enzyme
MSDSTPRKVKRDHTLFLLDEKKETDYDRYRGPVRMASQITPLIDGDEVFRTMEEYIYNAKTCVFLTSWSFDPALPITSSIVKSFKLSTWLDLLLNVAKRGVQVNVLMNDFDPVFQFEPHNGVWNRYRRLVEAADQAKLPADKFQVVCSRHQIEIAALVVLTLKLTPAYARIVARLNTLTAAKRKTFLRDSPGLWEIVVLGKDGKAALRDPQGAYPAFPASHHQKAVLVDERRAFAGGLNHIDVNREDRRHTRLARRGWHDGFVQVEGPIVPEVIRGLYGRWNEEHTRAKAFIDAADKQTKDFKVPFRKTSDLPSRITEEPKADLLADIPCQVHRTVSRSLNVLTRAAQTTCGDVLEGYLKAIGAADTYIYLENQYFRERRIAEAIVARAMTKPRLNVVLLLPFISEELLENSGDPITKHGAALQHDALQLMLDKLGPRCGIFSPFTSSTPTRLIYVHTKLLIVDDFYANLGSANANPRSFTMDTEMNLAWCDEVTAKTLRLNLWREQLGSATDPGDWDPATYVAKWTAIAKANAAAQPAYRNGFIMPFANDALGERIKEIPDALAQVLRAGDTRVA